MKKVSLRILNSLKPYLGLIVLSLILAIAFSVSSLYIPVLVGKGIDSIIGVNNVDFDKLNVIFIQMIILIVVASLSQYFMNLINNKITYFLTRDLRKQAFDKIESLPLSYLDSHATGDIISRLVADIDSVSEGLLLGFSQVFTGVVTIIVTLVYMFVLNYIMALVVLVLTPLSLFVARFIAKRIHTYFLTQSKVRGKQTGFISEIMDGQKVVRAFNHEKKDQEEFEKISDELYSASLKANFFSSLVNPSTRFVNATVYAIIALVGALIAINNSAFTAGLLTTFLSYATQYTKPFNDISSVITELQNAFTCAERVYELLDEQEEIKDVKDAFTLDPLKGNVNINDVSFSYTLNQHLIEHFNLSVKKGQRIAIVGPTGCGKTTLINLLMRFYDVNSGSITFDGINVKDIKRSSLRDNIGMVLQDTYLRYGTIYDNITMGNKNFTKDQVEKASKMAHAHFFISLLPKGYQTVIDEGGGQLSQGQKQLICIARIMLHVPPLLILDEATSSIDTRTELKIQDAFKIMMQGRTSFIVAHRLSTIKEADIIIVMNEGHIIEQGNHDTLLKQKGFYYKLYTSQYEK